LKKTLFVIISLLSSLSLLSYTYTVKQDGSGDYSTVQEAIDASATANIDSIIIYPGVYVENLEIDIYTGNWLTLASRYMATGDEQYIKDTIIDGGQSGSTVYIKNTQMCRLMGLTIRNGTGRPRNESMPTQYYGGGIYSENNTSNLIYKCIIENNFAKDGGGIYIDQGEVFLHSPNFLQ